LVAGYLELPLELADQFHQPIELDATCSPIVLELLNVHPLETIDLPRQTPGS